MLKCLPSHLSYVKQRPQVAARPLPGSICAGLERCNRGVFSPANTGYRANLWLHVQPPSLLGQFSRGLTYSFSCRSYVSTRDVDVPPVLDKAMEGESLALASTSRNVQQHTPEEEAKMGRARQQRDQILACESTADLVAFMKSGFVASGVLGYVLLHLAKLQRQSQRSFSLKASEHPREVVELVLELCGQRGLKTFTPAGVAQLVYGMAKAQVYDAVVLSSALDTFFYKKANFNFWGTSCILWGLTLLEYPLTRGQRGRMYEHLLDIWEEENVPGLVNIVGVLDHTDGPCPDILVSKLLDALGNCPLGEVRPHELTQIVTWKHLKAHKSDLSSRLASEALDQLVKSLDRVPACDLTRITAAIHDFPGFYHRSRRTACRAMVRHLHATLSYFDQDHLADILYHLAGLKAKPYPEFIDDVLVRSHTLLPQMSSRGLTRLLWALSAFGIRPYRAWMSDYYAVMRREASSFTQGDLPRLMQALAILRCQPDDEIMHLLGRQIQKHLPALSRQDLATLVEALTSMFPILPGRSLKQLVDQMRARARYLQ